MTSNPRADGDDPDPAAPMEDGKKTGRRRKRLWEDTDSEDEGET
eukprot:CAMPEP_0119524428 /NCGR_PEP_ID=MMETSP1344-20130328/39360_1 /TAXON_ID=236787 /ORGANISM="Florenciella parvula, Strain CCMP2471" /LENGTH=43 /DNA_ID= /DNA_START= /DNA_END= /DNA_ORIENTATION=